MLINYTKTTKTLKTVLNSISDSKSSPPWEYNDQCTHTHMEGDPQSPLPGNATTITSKSNRRQYCLKRRLCVLPATVFILHLTQDMRRLEIKENKRKRRKAVGVTTNGPLGAGGVTSCPERLHPSTPVFIRGLRLAAGLLPTFRSSAGPWRACTSACPKRSNFS